MLFKTPHLFDTIKAERPSIAYKKIISKATCQIAGNGNFCMFIFNITSFMQVHPNFMVI